MFIFATPVPLAFKLCAEFRLGYRVRLVEENDRNSRLVSESCIRLTSRIMAGKLN